tara:strand:+ start:2082 stop:2216 length:135 start_codon:yes stop_codon:yes gene_type:complete
MAYDQFGALRFLQFFQNIDDQYMGMQNRRSNNIVPGWPFEMYPI